MIPHDFTGTAEIQLMKGQEYDILESCGMTTIRGEYLGVAHRAYMDELLVFKIIGTSLGDSRYRYCGGYLRVETPRRTEHPARIYLQQTHYGHAIATLRKVGSREDNRWEMRDNE